MCVFFVCSDLLVDVWRFNVWCSVVFVVRCLVVVVCWCVLLLVFFVRCVLVAGRCSLSAACCLLAVVLFIDSVFAVRCALFVVCWLSFAGCS